VEVFIDKMFLGIQLIGILFALLMIYLAFVSRKRQEFTSKEYILWIALWAVFLIIAIHPEIVDPILFPLSVGRPLDLFIIGGFMVMLGMGFYTYTLVRRLQSRIENLVRKIALEGKKKRK